MKTLLITKAVVETLAGVAFAALPSTFIYLLLGQSLDEPEAVAGVRMFGVAAFAIGLACWLARNDSSSPAARALTIALLFYDLAIITILLSARFEVGLSGLLLWPVVAIHVALAAFSVRCLRPGHVDPLSTNLPASPSFRA